MSAQATPVCGRRRRPQPRPSSVCSTDSNFSSVSTHFHQRPHEPAHFNGQQGPPGHRRQNRLHPRRLESQCPRSKEPSKSVGQPCIEATETLCQGLQSKTQCCSQALPRPPMTWLSSAWHGTRRGILSVTEERPETIAVGTPCVILSKGLNLAWTARCSSRVA